MFDPLTASQVLRPSSNGQGGRLRIYKSGFNSSRAYHPAIVQLDRARRSECRDSGSTPGGWTKFSWALPAVMRKSCSSRRRGLA